MDTRERLLRAAVRILGIGRRMLGPYRGHDRLAWQIARLF